MKLLECYLGRAIALGLMVGAGAGCASVELHEYRFLAKPSMQFADSALFADYPAILPQIETGAAASGGSQATTCNACR